MSEIQTQGQTTSSYPDYTLPSSTTAPSGIPTTPLGNKYESGDTASPFAGTLGKLLDGGAFFSQNSTQPQLIPPLTKAPYDPSAPPSTLNPDQKNQVALEYQNAISTEIQSAVALGTLSEADATILTNAVKNSALSQLSPALVSLYNQLTATEALHLRAEYSLPSNWTPSSTSDSEWTPTTAPSIYSAEEQSLIVKDYTLNLQATLMAELKPENKLTRSSGDLTSSIDQLSPEDKTVLQSAITTGTLPSGASQKVQDIFNQAQSHAIDATVAKFNLPASWTPTLPDVSNWTTAAVSEVQSPIPTGNVFAQTILNNITKMTAQVGSSGQNLLNSLPNTHPSKPVLVNFLMAIASAIDNLKNALASLQATDAKISQSLNAAKFSELGARRQNNEQAQKLQDKQYNDAWNQSHQSQKMSLIMKIVGPIVSAIICLIGVICCIPVGEGAPLIAAGITIGIIMTGYSIADSQCNLTQKMMQAMMAWLASLSPAVRGTMIAILVAIVVVVIVVCTVASPGTSASIFTNFWTQTAIAATKEVVLNVAMMMILGSGILEEAAASMGKAMGANEGEIMAMTVLLTVLVAVVGVKAGEAKTASLKGMMNSIKATATDIAESAKDLAKSIQALPQKLEASFQGISKSIVESYNNLTTDFAASLAQVKAALKNPDSAALVDALAEKAGTTFRNLLPGKKNALVFTETLLKAVPSSIEIAGNIMQYNALKDLAALLNQLGENQAAAVTIQEMIKLLTKLLDRIMQALNGPAAEIGDLLKQAMKLFSDANQALQFPTATHG